jgi:gliding motility-associated-like protein
MSIFNRWGDHVFDSDKIDDGWDGTHFGVEEKQDVYVYRIDVEFYSGKHETILGHVNLIR